MLQFKRILVGIDLCWQGLVSRSLRDEDQEAARQAIWLANKQQAQLHFLSAIDVSEHAIRLIEASGAGETTVQLTTDCLQQLIALAQAENVTATEEIAPQWWHAT